MSVIFCDSNDELLFTHGVVLDFVQEDFWLTLYTNETIR